MKKSSFLMPLFVLAAVAVYAMVGVVFFFNQKNEVSAVNDNVQSVGFWTVTFDSRGGTEVKKQQVVAGGYVKKPDKPERPGCEFTGWYNDANCEDEFDFETPILRNRVLYAGWKVVRYVVTIDDGFHYPEEMDVIQGDTIDEITPVYDNLEFLGWYTDPDYKNAFSFDTKINKDLTLYGKWALDFELMPNGTYGITAYHGSAQSLNLPSVFRGKAISYIGDFAFEDCTTLTNLVLPSTLTQIDYCAFYGCAGLTSITIPQNVSQMGGSVFKKCDKLNTINCFAQNKPVRWDERWNKACDAEVVWGFSITAD